MGGEEKVDKQHQRGKLTVRERLELLYDPGTFVELGLLASQQSLRGAEADPDGTPADGVVTGHGEIEGRQVWVIAYDFTVMAGSMGAVGSSKPRASASWPCAIASRSSGCSTPPGHGSRRRRARRLPAQAGCSPNRS